jgi:hypothetical protein
MTGRYAWYFIFAGTLILLMGLLFGELAHYFEIACTQGTVAQPNARIPFVKNIISTLILFVQTIGVTSIVVGILNIIIGLDDLKKYFEERLRGVVTHESYLDKLSLPALGELRNNVLKSHFHDTEIDREGGFLTYFDKNLYKYIGSPYRESTISTVSIRPTDDVSQWHVMDRVRYTCRKVCGTIQPSVAWRSDQGVEMLKLQVQVVPADADDFGKREFIAKLEKKDFSGPFSDEFSLSKYKDQDGLVIELEAEYYIKKTQFQAWTMAIPTKGFNLTILYPKETFIQCEVLILDQTLISRKEEAEFLNVASDTWVLPESGLVWRVFDQVNDFDRAQSEIGMKDLRAETC